MAEGLPTASKESIESLVTDDECVAAMKTGTAGRKQVQKWYAQLESVVDLNPGPHSRIQHMVRLAYLQFVAGAIDSETGEHFLFQTLEDARLDAFERYDDIVRLQIESLIEERREELQGEK